MPFIYNLHRQKNIRRYFRNHPTSSERWLWLHLKGRKLNGLKFRRQYGIRQFVVDFYCPALKLAIEIDGAPHRMYAHKKYHDAMRQQTLEWLGIRFIRFSAQAVLANVQSVLEEIKRVSGGHP